MAETRNDYRQRGQMNGSVVNKRQSKHNTPTEGENGTNPEANQSTSSSNETCLEEISITQSIRASSIKPNGKRRLCRKSDGRLNTKFTNIHHRQARLVQDWFITIVDFKWRYLILFCSAWFMMTWTFFAVVYYCIMHITDDFEKHNEHESKCFLNVKGFSGLLLFSLETQTTVGYGYRTLTENCPSAIIALWIHSIIGIIFDSVVIATTLSKMVRSNKRKWTIAFSKKASIALYNGDLCFMFRLGDFRINSNMFEAHVRLYFVTETRTEEGEIMPITFTDMNVGYDTGEDRIMVVTPIIIRHIINSKSPLYKVSKANLSSQSFEILVVLEGNIEQIGVTAQCRTSYTTAEIVWGHYYTNCIEHRGVGYIANFALFDSLYEGQNQKVCSAEELEQLQLAENDNPDNDTNGSKQETKF
ncbi:inward rectifier potassium channel 4-like isoform X2 [Convolutriloba macropyga]|uniref:inward rectifier potassium channel 4-like isoform X2 n=1 Tax=Convolutriloba macropyga TaxID=536237 RepID=UPI003F52737A